MIDFFLFLIDVGRNGQMSRLLGAGWVFVNPESVVEGVNVKGCEIIGRRVN
jgi:hypothetical protein